MGLVQENIRVKVNNFNKNHFENLGYYVEINSYINIKVKELPIGSGLKIKVKCDYCGKEFDKPYRRYLETKDKTCCDKCKTQKFQETNIKKYGNVCSLRDSEIENKMKQSNIEKYGVEYPLQSKKIREKCKQSLENNYFVTNNKHRNRKNNKCNSVYTSKAQDRINKLYNGTINYKIYKYHIDVYLEKYKICCEYNGGGHNLSVIHGSITQEDFDKKEKNRTEFLLNMGYKCFFINSSTDKLPSDEKLIEIKERAIDNLINRDNDIYIYDIENKSEKLLKCNEL